jgi:uncharacterized membrane protein YobD (UPF0266 family)
MGWNPARFLPCPTAQADRTRCPSRERRRSLKVNLEKRMDNDVHVRYYNLRNRKELPNLFPIIILFFGLLILKLFSDHHLAFSQLLNILLLILGIAIPLFIFVLKQPPIVFDQDGLMIYKSYFSTDIVQYLQIKTMQFDDELNTITIKTENNGDLIILLSFMGYDRLKKNLFKSPKIKYVHIEKTVHRSSR